MSAPLPLIARTRLEKAAHDNGFDRPAGEDGAWLIFDSSHAPGRLWLTVWAGAHPVAAFSHPGVARALTDHGVAVTHPVPAEAVGARSVTGYDQLHALLRRAALLARTLPDALWERYEAQTAALPKTTEAERLVVQRVGQDVFRQGLLDLWGGRCALSGLAVPALLRASHAKPWKDCANDQERLDAHNGLLLAAHLDAAFDAGLITVEDDGRVVVSAKLDGEARGILGLAGPARVRGLAAGHRVYLAWHRERVFEGG
ncbi:MAG: HNH endonuclease [Deltaproteobacteria bacterium]|nr:HNH endonuclease [Deltaproteobacteria bacterium]